MAIEIVKDPLVKRARELERLSAKRIEAWTKYKAARQEVKAIGKEWERVFKEAKNLKKFGHPEGKPTSKQ